MTWELRFVAPTLPWSENDEGRMHWAKARKKHKAWREAAYLAARRQFPPGTTLPPCVVHITIPFTTNRNRDPHNYIGTVCKRIIDGLGPERSATRRKQGPKQGLTSIYLGLGLWPDDNEDWVKVAEPTLVKDPSGVVIVRLTPWEEIPG